MKEKKRKIAQVVHLNETYADLIDKHCLFINNLDYLTKEEEVTLYFQSFGPVKRCLVIQDAVTGHCRGYGFVKFQRAEDAAKVLECGQRLVFCGQRILVDYALRRTKTDKSDQQEEDTPWVAPKSSKLLGLGKGTSAKQLLDSKVSRNSQDIAKRTILIKPVLQVPWLQQFKELLYPLKGFLICIGPIRGILHCIFSTREAAKEHISYLQQSCKKWQSNLDVTFAHVPITKRCTVVVRNLPFATSEEELMNTFSKSGPVKLVRLPKNIKYPNVCLGYGFVEYFLPKDAESAIRNLNGIELNGRMIAVDYALSKDKYLQEKQSIDMTETCQEKYKDNHVTDKSSSVHIDSKDNPDKRTILIRNLPLGVHESQIESCFEAFGKIEKCWIDKEKNTGQNNGLAYVRFIRQHSVVNCLRKANELSEEWEDPILQKKLRNSSLAKEVSAGGIRLDGRRLIVCHALKVNSQENKENEQRKKDAETRNLHLLKEGFIDPKSKLAKMYSETELQKRLALYEWKKQKVERNPNIIVSSTRLCIHQLPRSMTEKELRKLIQIVAKEEMANMNMSLSSQKKIVKNAFILRDSKRKLKDGSFRSTCRGFVQFLDPLVAEKCLQRLNRDSDILETFHEEWKGRRLIVENKTCK
ncbi:RNA-binding protein [Galdieria sulphuraria]|uniref:RNA-binding protein n=1 Tax=Galdieria sulphuraria TaxID=130081 RepID=M2WYI7_GALSU|nr:RNA-binding protein [Galdieria sulphuraria]EME29125.1 RNA-binding protein [Galdieria sulphuraria]|eukprot:XP_005705645.1 RNA-binding protein [Galdieria sulphuraria]